MKCKPFIKFVGGKRAIINELLSRVPSDYKTYFEPFLGGGALYFALLPEKAILSDINKELILTWVQIKVDAESLIKKLKKFPYTDDQEANEETFKKIRKWDRSSKYDSISSLMKASRMIYLNKTCYNGLYRVNSDGYFNSPFGKYSNPKICDEENLRKCSKVLGVDSISIFHSSYENPLRGAEKGDFVYLDPPYVPLSRTANFTSYSSSGFGLEDQKKLALACRDLDKRGVRFMLSNSNTKLSRRLYQDRFNVEVIESSRSINREKGSDIIVRNYD